MEFKKDINKIFFTIISLILLLSSCNDNKEAILVIEGKINGYSEKTIVLESLMPLRVDTINVVKTDAEGNFKFSLDSLPGGFLRLCLDNKNCIYLYGKEKQTIEIQAKYPDIVKSYNITGSEDSKKLKELNLRLLESSDKLNIMREEILNASKDSNCNLDSVYNISNINAKEIYENDKIYIKDFIDNNIKSPIIYIALYQYVSSSPILLIEKDLPTFKLVLSSLKKYNPNFSHISLLESNINKEELRQQQLNRNYVNISIGAKAPGFSINNISGKKVNLDDFNGEKVIIAFWASWHKTSVENMKYLEDISNKKDIKIISISLDSNKHRWENSITSKEMKNFYNLCDFKSWENTAVKIYGIKSLPFYVLINEDTKIEALTNDIHNLTQITH